MTYSLEQYRQLKHAQHAFALARARRARAQGRHADHAYHLERAAVVRNVLALDLNSERLARASQGE